MVNTAVKSVAGPHDPGHEVEVAVEVGLAPGDVEDQGHNLQAGVVVRAGMGLRAGLDHTQERQKRRLLGLGLAHHQSHLRQKKLRKKLINEERIQKIQNRGHTGDILLFFFYRNHLWVKVHRSITHNVQFL